MRISSDEKFARALAATLIYFAKCDGSVCEEEQALLDIYWSVVNKSKRLSTEIKQEIACMPNLEFTFDQITEFLDAVKAEELYQIKELVRKLIKSSEEINDVEKQQYFKLVHYDAQRTK